MFKYQKLFQKVLKYKMPFLPNIKITGIRAKARLGNF